MATEHPLDHALRRLGAGFGVVPFKLQRRNALYSERAFIEEASDSAQHTATFGYGYETTWVAGFLPDGQGNLAEGESDFAETGGEILSNEQSLTAVQDEETTVTAIEMAGENEGNIRSPHFMASRASATLAASAFVATAILTQPRSSAAAVTTRPAYKVSDRGSVWYNEAVMQLQELGKLEDGWDGYGTAAPNDVALKCATHALRLLQEMGFQPSDILPSAEEGIGLTFAAGSKYADIELFNDGSIVAVTDDRSLEATPTNPHIWEVGDADYEIQNALLRIREFFDG